MQSDPRKQGGVASIILSGGSSTRMGYAKALLEYKETTFVRKLISDYSDIGCDPVVVVLGKHADIIQPVLDGCSVITAVNYHPEGGPLSSLKIGVSVLSRDLAGFFFTLVDHPTVKVQTLLEMLNAWDGNADTIVRPRYEGRGGHPVLLGKSWIDRVFNLPDSSNMREALNANSTSVKELSVSDPGICTNIDTPEDYQKLLKGDD